MPNCAVKWCGNNSRHNNFKKDNITFHRFPADVDTKKIWISKTMRGENWCPTSNSTICSRHFASECFIEMKGRRKLFQPSIPTLFLPILNSLQDNESSERRSGTEITRKEIVQSSDVNILVKNDSVVNLDCPHPCSSIHSGQSRKRTLSPSYMLQSPTCTPRKKKLCYRIINLRNHVLNKNKQIKRLQSNNRYLKKKIATVKTILKELESKYHLSADSVGILSRLYNR